MTALMVAVDQGQHEAAKVLIGGGAAVNLADAEGRTALMLAASHLDDRLFVPLLDAGADATLKASNGWTALLFACAAAGDDDAAAGFQNEVVEKLIDWSECRGKPRDDLELQAALGMARKAKRSGVVHLLEDMINDEEGMFTPR